MSTGGASTTQVRRRGGGRLQPTPLGISSNCLLVPSALTHPQAHAVFPTPRSFVFQNKPWVLRPPSLHSTNPIFLECPSLQFIFLVFIPPPLYLFLFPPLCSPPSISESLSLLQSTLNAAFHFSSSSITRPTTINLILYQAGNIAVFLLY